MGVPEFIDSPFCDAGDDDESDDDPDDDWTIALTSKTH
jgi:hypothetical protein